MQNPSKFMKNSSRTLIFVIILCQNVQGLGSLCSFIVEDEQEVSSGNLVSAMIAAAHNICQILSSICNWPSRMWACNESETECNSLRMEESDKIR